MKTENQTDLQNDTQVNSQVNTQSNELTNMIEQACGCVTQQKKGLSIDINMTENCSLRCTYCIENFDKPKLRNATKEHIDKIIQRVDEMLASPKFNEDFDNIRLNFWGGEPTVNFKGMKQLLEYYENNPRVTFLLYTNAYKYEHCIDFLTEYQKRWDMNKLTIQVSYDGLASHDVARVDIKGKKTALKVKENLLKMHEMGAKLTVHPTIAWAQLDKLADNYYEFKRMREVMNLDFIDSYGPTIDYMSVGNFTPEEMQGYLDTYDKEIKKILKDEIEFFKKNGRFFFSWLNPSKPLCSAGGSIAIIDLNGDVSPCHGVMNSSKYQEQIYTNIEHDNFIDRLVETTRLYDSFIFEVPEACQNCSAHYCLKCNSTKYELSKKETYIERWMDFTNQDHMCKLYKHNGLVRQSILNIIQKQNQQSQQSNK